MKQTERVLIELRRGSFCGRWGYMNGLPNGRTRAGEIARKLGKVLVSEPCRHRTSTEPSYRDYRLAEPTRQLTLTEAA